MAGTSLDQLGRTLAVLYDRRSKVEHLLKSVGLPVAGIDLAGDSLDIWRSILRVAEQHRLTSALILAAMKVHPAATHLEDHLQTAIVPDETWEDGRTGTRQAGTQVSVDSSKVQLIPYKLTGEQVGMFRDALAEAFPSMEALAQMTHVQCNIRLEGLVNMTRSLRNAAYELVVWAESTGRLNAVARGAFAENPDSPALRAFILSLGYISDGVGSIRREPLSLLFERKQNALSANRDTAAIDAEIARERVTRRRGHHFSAGEYIGQDGRYQLLRELGRGGFATVWDAWDPALRRHVAVKVLHGHLNSDEVRLKRFQSGARKMQRLEHRNIVQVLEGCQQWEDFHFFVMRFVGGGDLRNAVLADGLDFNRRLQLIATIGDALGYAHAQQIIHGDVKPANVLLTEAFEPKLSDFDLAQGADSTTHSDRGVVMGSALYTAPEVLHEAGVADERSDVFSLACTAFFVVLGRDFSLNEWMQPAEALQALCPKPVANAIARGMRQDPRSRTPMAMEFVEELTIRGTLLRPIAARPSRAAEQGQVESATPCLQSATSVFGLSPMFAVAGASGSATLLVPSGGGLMSQAILGPNTMLGRDPTCDVVLVDSLVSRQHARIQHQGQLWELIDLGSSNGTRVNGIPCTKGPLKWGDTITLGRSQVVFEAPDYGDVRLTVCLKLDRRSCSTPALGERNEPSKRGIEVAKRSDSTPTDAVLAFRSACSCSSLQPRDTGCSVWLVFAMTKVSR